MRFSHSLAGALVIVAALAVACSDDDKGNESQPATTSSPAAVAIAPDGPATFSVIAGTADGPFDIEQFMPATIRIREGDTIVWKGSGHEGHTVTFIPPNQSLVDAGLTPYLAPAPDMPEALEFNPRLAVTSENQGA